MLLRWVELPNLQEDDGEGVESHRLDQHERQNQGETDCGGCARVAGESFAGCGGGFGLGVTASGRGDGHGKAGGNRDPVCTGASGAAVSCAKAAGASKLMATTDSRNSAYLFIVKLLV